MKKEYLCEKFGFKYRISVTGREKIYRIIEHGDERGTLGTIYDSIMLLAILASIVPLMFAREYPAFWYVELVTCSLFVVDYLLRWITADFRLKKGVFSFFLYPFTVWAIIDLLSILPCLTPLSRGFKLFRITRLMKVLRLFKFLRYFKRFQMLNRVLKKEKDVLLSVLGVALFYIFLTALIMFIIEPHVNPVTGEVIFADFFDALYWATVTLTTVGYGDLTPVTDVGRLVSMLSSLFGIAIIALPSGVITASYMDELKNMKKESAEKDENDGVAQ